MTGDDDSDEEPTLDGPRSGEPGAGPGSPVRLSDLASRHRTDAPVATLFAAPAANLYSFAAVPACTGAGLTGAGCGRFT
jgi:hypothetical protein